jgi:hypothetical protein
VDIVPFGLIAGVLSSFHSEIDVLDEMPTVKNSRCTAQLSRNGAVAETGRKVSGLLLPVLNTREP